MSPSPRLCPACHKPKARYVLPAVRYLSPVCCACARQGRVSVAPGRMQEFLDVCALRAPGIPDASLPAPRRRTA